MWPMRVVSARERLTWAAAPVAILAAGAALASLVASLTGLPPGEPPGATGEPGAPPGALPAAGPPATRGLAEDRLELARQHFARNRGDAPGASQEGLLRAEAEVEAALRLGLQDLAEARRLLADVNGALGREWAVADQQRRVYRQREREALRGLLELVPRDAGARYRYAMLIEERGWRIEELTLAASEAPGDYRPRRALGEDLLEAGKADEGARRLVEAAALCDREALGHQGPDIVRLLRYHGREEEEALVRERMGSLGY